MRLLTDEEILKASQVEMFLPNGDLDPDCGYLRGRQQVADAEHKATLKAVGELLSRSGQLIDNPRFGKIRVVTEKIIETLKRGELPEEKK